LKYIIISIRIQQASQAVAAVKVNEILDKQASRICAALADEAATRGPLMATAGHIAHLRPTD